MHPGFMAWKRARLAHLAEDRCGAGFHGGEGFGRHGPHEEGGFGFHGFGQGFAQGFGGGDEGRGFGVRRPLRFLAYKLDLSEPQSAELARILDALKTERAQASVDDRRAVASLADAVSGATFDADKAGAASKARVDSADRLNKAVSEALAQIHALLEPEQRERFAYLVRTGTLAL